MSKKKQYQVIGAVLCRTNPELAKQISSVYLHPEAPFSDYSQIPDLLQSFCEILGVPKSYLVGSINLHGRVSIRKVFIGVMIRLYNPQLHNQPKNCIYFREGFCNALARNMELHKGYMSRLIKSCVSDEAIYEDIKLQVDKIAEQLLNKAAG